MRREVVVSVQQGGIVTATGYKRPIGPCNYVAGQIVYTDGNFVMGSSSARSRGILPVYFTPVQQSSTPVTPINANSWLLLSADKAYLVTYDGSVKAEQIVSSLGTADYPILQRAFCYNTEGFVCADLYYNHLSVNWNNKQTTVFNLDSGKAYSTIISSVSDSGVSLLYLKYIENEWDQTHICEKTTYKKDGSTTVEDFSSSVPIQLFNSLVFATKTECNANSWYNTISFKFCLSQSDQHSYILESYCTDNEKDSVTGVDYRAKEVGVQVIVENNKETYRVKDVYELYQQVLHEETGSTILTVKMNSFDLKLAYSDIQSSYIDTAQIGSTEIEINQSVDNVVIPLLILPTTDGSDLFWLFGTLYLVKSGNVVDQQEIGNIYNHSLPNEVIDDEKLKSMIKA